MTENDICGAITSDGDKCTFSPKHADGKCGHHTEETDTYSDRDSKLTKQRQEEIAQAIEQGKSLTSASRMAGIDRTTVYNWLEKGEDQEEGVYAEFFNRITHAKGHGEDKYFKTVWELAKEQGDHRFLASLMKQRYPDSWDETETGVEADTVNIEISENVTDTWPEIRES